MELESSPLCDGDSHPIGETKTSDTGLPFVDHQPEGSKGSLIARGGYGIVHNYGPTQVCKTETHMTKNGFKLIQASVVSELVAKEAGCYVRSRMPFTNVFIDEHKTQMYMPRANKSLHDQIAERVEFTQAQIRSIGVTIGAYLSDLHAAGLSHNDVRPPNILTITCLNQYFVTDEGLARPVLAPVESDMVMCRRTKPPGKMAQHEKVDGWGMGICLLACVERDWYLDQTDIPDNLPHVLRDCDADLRKVIIGLLNPDEDKRLCPTAAMKILGYDEVIKPKALWSVSEDMLKDIRLSMALSRAKCQTHFVSNCAEPLRRLLLWELSCTGKVPMAKLYIYMALAMLIYGYDLEVVDMLKSMKKIDKHAINLELVALIRRGALKASRLPSIVVSSVMPCKRRLV